VGPIFAGTLVDVDILRCTTFIDAGLAVHPSYVEGQMQGGTVQGLGWALNEAMSPGNILAALQAKP